MLVNPKLCFPSFFPSIVHDRAKVSSVCAVRISSQSLARDDECDIEVIVGNFREASGIESEVAFFNREPKLSVQRDNNREHEVLITL